jgi:SRSO17 transposase
MTSSPWNPAHVRATLAWRMLEAIKPTALIVDDTGFFKDGDASACVSRQYTGTAGKVTNCRVGLSLHLTRDHASTPVNWRLFLPKSWDRPRTRPIRSGGPSRALRHPHRPRAYGEVAVGPGHD